MRKGTWAKDEDELLVKHVQKQIKAYQARNKTNDGTESVLLDEIKLDWVEISAGVGSRTGKQCRERWINHLNPDLKKSRWTPEEDKKLLELGEQYPSKWAVISRKLAGRSQNQVKIRWNTLNNANKRGTKRKLQPTETGHDTRVLYPPLSQARNFYALFPYNAAVQPSFPNLLQTSQLFQQPQLNVFGYGNEQIPFFGLPQQNLFGQQPPILTQSFLNTPLTTQLSLGQTQQQPSQQTLDQLQQNANVKENTSNKKSQEPRAS